ncbi:MAG: hypothetical protein ACRDP4_04580 [Nocardioidaceae bacterium]
MAAVVLVLGGGAAVIILLVGGDDDDSDQATTGVDTTISTTNTAPAATSSTTTGSTRSPDPTATSETTGGDPGDSDYCQDMRENAQSNEFDNLDLSIPADREKMAAEAERLRDEAPEEIRGDYEVLIKVLEGTSSDTAKLQVANEEIQRYAEDTCDLEYE